MTNEERLLLERLSKEHNGLKRMYDRHRSYENLLQEYNARVKLSTQEESEVKMLKVKKLQGKEEMLKLAEKLSIAESNIAA